MTEEKISAKQVICIIILFTLGSNLITGGNTMAKQDSWISLILGFIFSIPIMIIFAQFKKVAPDKDLFDLSYIVLGKVGGTIITFLFTFYALRLGGMVIRNFTEFIQVVSLAETPQFINAICIGFIGLYTLKKGFEVFARGCTFVFPVSVFIIFILNIFAIKHMNIGYIKPIMGQDLKTIAISAFYNVIFPFAETALFISVFPMVNTKKNPTKIYIFATGVATFLFATLVVRNILVLGIPMLQSLYFPTYAAVSIISIKEFITRIEVLVSGNFIICGLAKITVCMFVSSKGVARLFNIKDYKKLLAPVALLMIAISGFVFESTMHMFESINNRKFYILIFQLGIPLIVLIFAKIKAKRKGHVL